MYNSNIPDKQEIPSSKQLLKSTMLAAIVAVVLLVCVVMPAEYGIDPTGAGKVIGLQRMGEIKVSLAREEAADRAQDKETLDQSATTTTEAKAVPTQQNHEMQVVLAPDEGTEIKLAMAEGGTVKYEWWTDGGKATFDAHADSKALAIDYHSYSKGSEEKMAGSLEAAFDGSHGWYWRNRTSEPLTITLKTDGMYSTIRHMK